MTLHQRRRAEGSCPTPVSSTPEVAFRFVGAPVWLQLAGGRIALPIETIQMAALDAAFWLSPLAVKV
jgi:hypothetical protein